MKVQNLAGIVLIVAGILALVYGGFSYTRETHNVDLGPVNIAVEEKQRVNVPIWGGAAAIVLGAGLLILRRRI